MRFWFARDGGVPIREQLVTQIVLGIVCGDLAPGQRLPSTRELARRFSLHPNTVSVAYRHLQRDGWVEFRRGSGVYIRRKKPEAALSPAFALDQLIANLFRSARELGAPLSAVQSRLRHWLTMQPPDHFLLIEPDADLRPILVAEMQRALSFPVSDGGLESCVSHENLQGAIPVALSGKVEQVRQVLPRGTELLELHYRSVPSSLDEWLPAPADAIIAVASGWPGFLKLARTILIAAGFHQDSLVFRDARQRGWQRGLKQMVAVVCDSVTAAEVPKGCRVISFSLISESSVDELRRYQQFIRDSLTEPS
ncbi:MAG: GntR family transcriptional regulator [Candidatus Acidiferrales bacterium]